MKIISFYYLLLTRVSAEVRLQLVHLLERRVHVSLHVRVRVFDHERDVDGADAVPERRTAGPVQAVNEVDVLHARYRSVMASVTSCAMAPALRLRRAISALSDVRCGAILHLSVLNAVISMR